MAGEDFVRFDSDFSDLKLDSRVSEQPTTADSEQPTTAAESGTDGFDDISYINPILRPRPKVLSVNVVQVEASRSRFFSQIAEHQERSGSATDDNLFFYTTRARTEDVVLATDLSPCMREFSDKTDPSVIIQFCQTLLASWSNIASSEITVSKILSGLTNQLFSVFLREGQEIQSQSKKHSKMSHPNRVLFRIYGKDVGSLYDSSFEVEVFKKLAEKGIAPQLLGEFSGGRIEEWIYGSALAVEDARSDYIIPAVAEIVGGLHKLNQDDDCFPKHWCREPSIFTNLHRWTDQVKVLLRDMPYDHPSMSILQSMDLPSMFSECLTLHDKIVPPSFPPNAATAVVFCHNDTQENNIMRVYGGDCLRLIDFEYSAFNYAGFDIANFFLELMIDYTHPTYPFYTIDCSKYPTAASRRLFAAVYLSKVLDRPVLPGDFDILTPFLAAVERIVLASHLMWGFWSIIRAPQAPTFTEFDYLVYARDRFNLYRKHLSYLRSQNAFGNACVFDQIMCNGSDVGSEEDS